MVEKTKIENQDILNTLGTEDYIQWTLEDKSVPAESKTRFCTLFITYYSLPDIVPHRPEECYIGGGLQGIKFETVMLRAIQGLYEREIKTRYLVFADTKSGGFESTEVLLFRFFTLSTPMANTATGMMSEKR